MITTGLIGYPTEHSISPMLFNFFAQINKIGYSHVKLTVSPKKRNLKRAIEGIRALDIKGVNVTLPYKIKVMEYINSIDPEAKKYLLFRINSFSMSFLILMKLNSLRLLKKWALKFKED